MSREVTNLLYLVTIVTFILALRFLSNPATARRGNQIGAAGMLVAIVVTFLQKSIDSYWEIALGMVVGGTFGARRGAQGADDGDAADGRALQRGRRWGCRADLTRGVPPAGA